MGFGFCFGRGLGRGLDGFAFGGFAFGAFGFGGDFGRTWGPVETVSFGFILVDSLQMVSNT